MKRSYDYLIIGSGLAGLSFALKVAHTGKVAIISKSTLEASNTRLAQGGVAAVTSSSDSWEQHIDDTLTAGAGLCNKSAVKFTVEQGSQRVSDLTDWGVQFDSKDGQQPSLGREGGHGQRRVLHVEDHTGLAIHNQLLLKVQEHKNIELLEEHFAVDLITLRQAEPKSFESDRCLGAYIFDKKRQEVLPVLAPVTVLATGGAGKVYYYTSNWSGATGDGIAMAYRAGARVANLEFMQFHPTCLYHPQSRNFLISEALRGEGGELINDNGEAFMKKHHEMGSLAPRDIVARSIDAEMKHSGTDCVFLDMTHKTESELKTRFPKIFERCMKYGINMAEKPIPVVPAAHYLCGGVMTDLQGQTDLPGLFALGETAHTGLHGANRLASNSLLECLAFSHSAANTAISLIKLPIEIDPPAWQKHDKEDLDELNLVSYMWEEIRRLMWAYVGIVRSNRRLERAQHRLSNILEEFQEYYSKFKPHTDVFELRNIALIADLTVKCARNRKESRGIHYNLDYKFNNKAGRDSILRPTGLSD